MLLILIAIVSQGFRVPSELRGHFGGSLLTLNQGVFQAIGVISFGKCLPLNKTSRRSNEISSGLISI